VIYTKAQEYLPNPQERLSWDKEGFAEWIMQHFPITLEAKELEESSNVEEIESLAVKRVLEGLEGKFDQLHKNISIPEKIADIVPDAGRQISEAVRNIMIRKVDEMWIEHLHSMDHLRHEVSLRSVGQRDPLMEFKHEAFRLFDEFGQELRAAIAHDLFRFEMVPPDPKALEKLIAKMRLETSRSFVDEEEKEKSGSPS
jgi:preprotein translocase subunit SecA